ncbi:MAG: DNA primase small subunit PriS [Candidatus Bathyarchaeota archaeon]|nr:MAG: DNA primase small subunit PriS [Candidatus Bathyarchaeota archaeon]
MDSVSAKFIHDRFSDYYRINLSTIQPPSAIEKREFGFILFKERMMVRHKAFRTVERLRDFLKEIVPSDAYYSSAYYELPEEKMEAKGRLGTDLIFDIDADHISTPCQKTHDRWICRGCGHNSKGLPPETCPSCGYEKFEEKSWMCEICLDSAKNETIKLIDFLMKDFGYSSEEIDVSFSGHRGYHVSVEKNEVHALDQVARREIVDYIIGIGIEPELHGLSERPERGTRIIAGPSLDALGWRGRIARGTYELLLSSAPQDLRNMGIKPKTASAISKHSERLLRSWKDEGPWSVVRDVGAESWMKLALYGVEKESAKIDTVVTTDIHRLIRLENTLHGKTGLKKAKVAATSIEGFDPFESAVAFKKGTAKVKISSAPQFRLGDESYGPYQNETVELPTAVALLLLCKRRAKMV